MASGDSTGGRPWGGIGVSLGGLVAAALLGINIYGRTYDSAQADITRAEVKALIESHSNGVNERIAHIESLLSSAREYGVELSAVRGRVDGLANRISALREQLESKTKDRITSTEHLHIEKRFVADIIRIEREIKELRTWVRDMR